MPPDPSQTLGELVRSDRCLEHLNDENPRKVKNLDTLTSDFYDQPELYDSLLPATAHIPYYVDLARRQAGEVLELACGTGQLAVPIAGAGLPTVGFDLSAAMLKAARERAAAATVSVEFVQGDMRQLIWVAGLRSFSSRATRCSTCARPKTS